MRQYKEMLKSFSNSKRNKEEQKRNNKATGDVVGFFSIHILLLIIESKVNFQEFYSRVFIQSEQLL